MIAWSCKHGIHLRRRKFWTKWGMKTRCRYCWTTGV